MELETISKDISQDDRRYNTIRSIIYKSCADDIKTDSIYSGLLADPKSIPDIDLGSMQGIQSNWSACTSCRLSKTRELVVVGSGYNTAKILIIGEAPGPEEDKNGVGFSGPTGTLLRTTLFKVGINVFDDVYFTNAVACIPKDTKESSFRRPLASEVTQCMPRITQIINQLKDLKVVLLLGKTAYVSYQLLTGVESSYSKLDTSIKMASVLGWSKNNTPLTYTTYHPSYIERQKAYASYNNEMQSWINDFKVIKRYLMTGEVHDAHRKT